MASYNGGAFIRDQLHSILGQLGPGDEVVISDDGSEDNTLSVIAGFHDHRIRVITHSGGRNLVANFENALTYARGETIFLSDQDDIWEKNKVRVIEAYLGTDDLVVSDCSVMDPSGNLMLDSYFKLRGSRPGLLRNLVCNGYMGCCMAFKKHLLDKALPMPAGIPMHDWWLGLVAEMTGSTCFCPERLVRYRRHAGNQTPLSGNRRNGLGRKLRFRYDMARALVRRAAELGLKKCS